MDNLRGGSVVGEKMYPMSMSPEGVTDDEISAASMSETDTSLLNSASLPTMDDDQSESNSETNNDSASGKKPFHRMATTQGKQGISLSTFPDRENTGNLSCYTC